MVETSVPAMETGEIDWEIMKSLGRHHTVAPQTTLSLNITSPKIYHFIVMHYPDTNENESVMEVRILNDYGEDKMGQAMFLKSAIALDDRIRGLPALPIEEEGRSWIDSTPSYVWASSSATDEGA